MFDLYVPVLHVGNMSSLSCIYETEILIVGVTVTSAENDFLHWSKPYFILVETIYTVVYSNILISFSYFGIYFNEIYSTKMKTFANCFQRFFSEDMLEAS